MNQQQDTTPYSDMEVVGVIARLLSDAEFLDFVGRYHSPRLARAVPGLVRFVVKRRLHGLLGEVRSIAEFQQIVAVYVEKIISETMTSFRYEGVERLHRDLAYVFVSNHRDIAGDSMLVDYALYESGHNTVRIAVGDNLVQRQFATDMMKLNKSFFIKRSEEGARRVYAALLDSSTYIHESLAEGESVWIAQAEGRAKSGLDLTDPAVIKMLVLAGRKESFATAIENLNIVPVSVSYEFDPCDILKARELQACVTDGIYVKPPGEDLVSLAKGLGGFKGHVRVHFGERLQGAFEMPEEVATEIDRQVLTNLSLFPVNFLALRELASRRGGEFESAWNAVSLQVEPLSDPRFEERLARCPVEWQIQWLTIYANPVLNKLHHGIAVSLASQQDSVIHLDGRFGEF